MNITRLAPSPTGALHLGNARTFLVNWLLARQQGWRIILRIEDLDGPRVKAGADREAIDDLNWLGLDWDDGPIYQSRRRDRYAAALERLIADGSVYPCTCSRREIEESASAPHGESGAIYPGTCRGRYRSAAEAPSASGRAAAMRFAAPAGAVRFVDGVRGLQEIEPARELGDFVVAKADGTPAYQLAVVVDDADMEITDVVRGDDLLGSTARQRLIYDALGWADRVPRYSHLPLVIGGDGRRLAKRHGDTRLSHYRNRGVAAGTVLALLGRWCGIEGLGEQANPGDLLPFFRIENLPREPITFTRADEAMLLAGGCA
jgi:glutamyl-tRNA synthetase